jgi:hypothetical protein
MTMAICGLWATTVVQTLNSWPAMLAGFFMMMLAPLASTIPLYINQRLDRGMISSGHDLPDEGILVPGEDDRYHYRVLAIDWILLLFIVTFYFQPLLGGYRSLPIQACLTIIVVLRIRGIRHRSQKLVKLLPNRGDQERLDV